MATLNDNDELELRQALLAKRLTEEISETFDVKAPRILKWGDDFIKHKNGTIAMPVYYLEYRDCLFIIWNIVIYKNAFA